MLLDSTDDFTTVLINEGINEDLGQLYIGHLDRRPTAPAGKLLYPAVLQFFKKPNRNFVGAREIPLPDPVFASHGKSLVDVLLTRRSDHHFSGEPMPLEQLSNFLRMGAGENGTQLANGQHRRTYASGGGMYANDLYLVVNRVRGLNPGLYHYSAQKHALHVVFERAIDLNDYFYDQTAQGGVERGSLEKAAFAVVYASFMRKVSYKYGERAWKLALLEAGHIGQNLYLTATALDGVLITSVGGCKESDLQAILPIDPGSEKILYAQIVGKA